MAQMPGGDLLAKVGHAISRSSDGGRTWNPTNTGIGIRTGPSGDAIPVFCLSIDPHDNDIPYDWSRKDG